MATPRIARGNFQPSGLQQPGIFVLSETASGIPRHRFRKRQEVSDQQVQYYFGQMIGGVPPLTQTSGALRPNEHYG
ncbi:hypothetical protein HYFRA_00011779 [Hymenoscyphus fraxineus]|uniref:Uncharacterized protein n=1 Tax=Hymenoscyphus fraxineus TaxID=746836 RepID=A0A9N9L674_9HELO|nr:hypothetical protein HYFRA_00011779 [Hymenoscyphus fraxineus]